MKNKKLNKCPKCGANEFWLDESLLWRGIVDDDGVLQLFNKGSDLTKIWCSKCDKEVYDYQFKDLNFS